MCRRTGSRASDAPAVGSERTLTVPVGPLLSPTSEPAATEGLGVASHEALPITRRGQRPVTPGGRRDSPDSLRRGRGLVQLQAIARPPAKPGRWDGRHSAAADEATPLSERSPVREGPAGFFLLWPVGRAGDDRGGCARLRASLAGGRRTGRVCGQLVHGTGRPEPRLVAPDPALEVCPVV